MIKKGIELQIISPSLLLKECCANREFTVCSVCKSKSLFLCRMICKYRQATYEEFEKFKIGGAKTDKEHLTKIDHSSLCETETYKGELK
jgi:hypothetical protein